MSAPESTSGIERSGAERHDPRACLVLGITAMPSRFSVMGLPHGVRNDCGHCSPATEHRQPPEIDHQALSHG